MAKIIESKSSLGRIILGERQPFHEQDHDFNFRRAPRFTQRLRLAWHPGQSRCHYRATARRRLRQYLGGWRVPDRVEKRRPGAEHHHRQEFASVTSTAKSVATNCAFTRPSTCRRVTESKSSFRVLPSMGRSSRERFASRPVKFPA